MRMRILVVDDEAFVRELLTHQLTRLGMTEVTACEGAQEALWVLREGHDHTDLVFCDLQMPEMDGVEFIRHLVGMGYQGGLVLVSGEDERILHTAEKLAHAHKLTMLGALHKPVSSHRLQQVLQERTRHIAALPRAERKTYGAAALLRAITNGELVNFYQPQVDVASCAITGVEALVRWRHPEDGVVFPDQFIHVAEENGLIDALTLVVLKAAVQDARLWQDAGFPLQVSVNVSMDNLAALDFPDVVEGVATDAGLPITSLTLEVTESQLMKNPRASLDILTRLRLKRIGLSIDDFGTGNSSLAQLHDIPFNELKVDRGFVHGACRDASLRAIVEASLGMAHQLGLKVVAEGVEDREDWEFLRTIGCDLAQGWFIAKAMPAAELPVWIDSWQRRHSSA